MSSVYQKRANLGIGGLCGGDIMKKKIKIFFLENKYIMGRPNP